jgi:hypothetical protein
VRNPTVKRFALVVAGFLVAVALSAPANTGSLREGSTGESATVTGSLPGQVLWTYYETTEVPFSAPVPIPMAATTAAMGTTSLLW